MTIQTEWIKDNMLDATNTQYRRRLTEAELKVQRSLQNLSIPDWYLNKRSTPPKILRNATPIEFRPSSWKVELNQPKVDLILPSDDQEPDQNVNTEYTQYSNRSEANFNRTSSTYQSCGEEYNTSSISPTSTIKQNNQDTINDSGSSRRSLSLPKMSPSRKIENINIVLPLQEPISIIDMEEKVFPYRKNEQSKTSPPGTLDNKLKAQKKTNQPSLFWSTAKDESILSDCEVKPQKKTASVWFYRNAKNLPEKIDPVSKNSSFSESRDNISLENTTQPTSHNKTVPNYVSPNKKHEAIEKPYHTMKGHVKAKVQGLLQKCNKDDRVPPTPCRESVSARNIVRRLITAWEKGPMKLIQQKSMKETENSKPKPYPRTRLHTQKNVTTAYNVGKDLDPDSLYVRYNTDIDEFATTIIETTKTTIQKETNHGLETDVHWVPLPKMKPVIIKTNSLASMMTKFSEGSSVSSRCVSPRNDYNDGKKNSPWFCSTMKKDEVISNKCRKTANLGPISDVSTIDDFEYCEMQSQNLGDDGTAFGQPIFFRGTYI